MASLPPHPMQPVMLAKDNVLRFRPNRIVQWMLAQGEAGERFDMNRIAIGCHNMKPPLEPDEWEQFYMLIGYSVSGFGDLNEVREETVRAADEAAAPLIEEWKATQER